MTTLSAQEFQKRYGSGSGPSGAPERLSASEFKARYGGSSGTPDTAPKKQGFFGGILEDLGNRASNVDAALRTGDSLPEKGLQTVGQWAGFAGDVIGRGVSAVIPDAVEEPVLGALGSLIRSKPGQALTGAYRDLQEEFPRASRNIGAVGNIASLLPAPKVLGLGGKAAGKAAQLAGEALVESGERSLAKGATSFVEDLVRASETPSVKLDQVRRTTETGFGPFKRSVVEPTFSEARAAKEVARVPGVSASKTMQQNYNLVRDFNVGEAKALKAALKANDFKYSDIDLKSRLGDVEGKFFENPALVGDGEKAARKILDKAYRLIDDSDKTGSSLLDVRQELDRWVKSQKGAGVFDASKESAFSIALKDIRTTMNQFLDSEAVRNKVPKSVRESLARQSALYDALENIAPKAAKEADTAIGRAVERMNSILGTKNRAVQVVAAMAGIGGLGAAATFAPAAAVVGGLGLLTYAGGKLVLKPELRIALGKALQSISRTATPAERKAIHEEIEVVEKVIDSEDLLEDFPEILSFDDAMRNADNLTVGRLEGIIKARQGS